MFIKLSHDRLINIFSVLYLIRYWLLENRTERFSTVRGHKPFRTDLYPTQKNDPFTRIHDTLIVVTSVFINRAKGQR